MFRISVTDLDAWEFYRSADWMTPEDWRRRLLRLDPPTAAMERGTRFHRMLETGGREFAADFDWAVDVDVPRPSVVELPVSRCFRAGGLDVQMRGRVDAVRGRTVIDYKTVSRDPDWAEYSARWQWRCYLAALPDCDRFEYQCFHIREQNGRTVVVGSSTLAMNRYNGLVDDVRDEVSQYIDMLKAMEAAGSIRLGPQGVVR